MRFLIALAIYSFVVSHVSALPGPRNIAVPQHAHPLSRFSPSPMGPALAFLNDDTASPAEFTTFASKGGALMCALTSTDRTAGILLRDTRKPPSAASIWTNGDLKAELHEWCWRVMAPSSKGCKLVEYWQFGAALQALGMADNGVCMRVEHWDTEMKDEQGNRVPAINQWYEVKDVGKFRATKAHYEFIVDVTGGAIYGLYLDSPKSSARTEWYGNGKDADPALLPRLRSFSDIMWAYWVRENPNIKNIRYFFMLGISNDQTNKLIASVLQKTGKTLSEWPGVSVGMDTDEGKALLGSPNGATFAYFLLQHKSQLGYKTISKVTIIRPENEDDNDFVDASLVFHVADAPEPLPDEENGGKAKEKRVYSYDYAVETVEVKKNGIRRVHTFGAKGRGDSMMEDQDD